jgi:hypothetical protein
LPRREVNVPNQPKTPLKRLRCDDALWDRFGALAEPDRSAVLRHFMRWYCREEGVTLPKRPAPPDLDPS